MEITSTMSPAPHAWSRWAIVRRLFVAQLVLGSLLLAAQAPGGGPTPARAASEPESCEYRVVNWNAAGSDPSWNAGRDIEVAESLFFYASTHGANVLTLQEVTTATLDHLRALLPGWSCYPGEFGVDYIAICVNGVGRNFNAQRLADVTPNPDPPLFWGYVQVEYDGALITSVHTRNHWDVEHVAELHRDVTTGIIAGDFNYETPEVNPLDPNDTSWFQTDLDLEPTWRDPNLNMEVKIDHILTIEEPLLASGNAEEKEGSNHRIVLGEVIFPPEAPEVVVSITSAQQPVEVDGSCTATVEFSVTVRDECCLNPDDLALDVTAHIPAANATLGPVSLDSVAAISPWEVEATGHVVVSELQSCPAQIVIEASARDCAGNMGDSTPQGGSATALVIDSTPPEVVAVQDDLFCLWPPNHRYVSFAAGQFSPTLTDNCTTSPAWAFESCTSDQPDNGAGDGNTIHDCVLDANAQGFRARAERAGGVQAGRRYGVAIGAVDACGNVSASTGIGSILVPHDQSPDQMCMAPPASLGTRTGDRRDAGTQRERSPGLKRQP